MIFNSKPVTWQLKPNVKFPFASIEESSLSVDNALETPIVSNEQTQKVNPEILTTPVATENTNLNEQVQIEPQSQANHLAENNVDTTAIQEPQASLAPEVPQVPQAPQATIQSIETTNQNLNYIKPTSDLQVNPSFETEQPSLMDTMPQVSNEQDPLLNTQNLNPNPNPISPILRDNNLYNLSTTTPMVDGVSVIPTTQENSIENPEQTSAIQSNQPRWMSMPYRLRKLRADVFVDTQSNVEYVANLVSYLKSKNIDVKDYDDSVHYLPSDILLLDKNSVVDAGIVISLQQGKRAVWNELVNELGDKLNGK